MAVLGAIAEDVDFRRHIPAAYSGTKIKALKKTSQI